MQESKIISQSYQLIWMGFGIPLRLVGVINHIFILSHRHSRERILLMRFREKQNKTNNQTLVCILDIYRPVSLKSGMVIETTKLYILRSVWMTWSSFKVTVV